jgi:hypothetical protein
VYYRNTQGTLMRILNAISRRGLDLPYVQAEAVQAEPVQTEGVATAHRVSLLLNLNLKQIGQLSRDWYAIADVAEVRAGAPTDDMMEICGTLGRRQAYRCSPNPPGRQCSHRVAHILAPSATFCG